MNYSPISSEIQKSMNTKHENNNVEAASTKYISASTKYICMKVYNAVHIAIFEI